MGHRREQDNSCPPTAPRLAGRAAHEQADLRRDKVLHTGTSAKMKQDKGLESDRVSGRKGTESGQEMQG